MVFRKSKIHRYFESNRDRLIVMFGIMYILLIVFFYNQGIRSCVGLNTVLENIIEENNYCNNDFDCRIFQPITDNCVLPGSCALSLNTNSFPYYFNNIIINFKRLDCSQDCVSVCGNENFIPICVNNVCDFRTQ